MIRTMTWKEFKAHVDAQLKAQDLSENTYIWYIDVSFPTTSGCGIPDVGADETSGLAID